MTTEALYKELSYVNHSRETRLFYANMVLDNTDLIPKLLDILFQVNDKISCRAAWVLEFMCKENLETLTPYLDKFTSQILKVHLDPAVRPVAKICEYLANAYYGKEASLVKSALLQKHKEKITEACFDWLINDQKVAPKAYSMNTLHLLGKDINWIYPELKVILERDFHMQSAAFKSRARHILNKINKKNL